LKEYDQAIKMFRQSIQLDNSYSDGHKNLGIALRDGGKYKGETQNDPQGALKYLLEAEKELPNDSETMRLLGVCYGRLGQTQKAIDYFEKQLLLAPENASAYFNLGIAYQNAGNVQKAQQNFKKAIAIDPEIMNRNR
jgi:tetratricopeptide (TPR) repeat protein